MTLCLAGISLFQAAKVTASGGAGAAGIGGGSNGDGGSVVLQGGTVDATGGTGAAGIGAGAKNSEDYTTNAGSITIAGGTVTAAGGAGAADIGAGANSTPVPADRVEITGGDVNSGATLDVSVGSGDAAGVVVIGPGAAVPGDTTVTTGYTLTLSLSEAQMTIGQTLRLTAVVTPEKAVVWASEDETLATVDAAGNVKALKEGNSENYRFAGRRRKNGKLHGDYKSGGSSAAASDFCARCGACGQGKPQNRRVKGLYLGVLAKESNVPETAIQYMVRPCKGARARKKFDLGPGNTPAFCRRRFYRAPEHKGLSRAFLHFPAML